MQRELKFGGKGSWAQPGRIELLYPYASPRSQRLIIALIVAWIACPLLAFAPFAIVRTPATLLFVPLFAIPIVALRLALRRFKGRDDLRIVFTRSDNEYPGVVYEAYYRNELVLSGELTTLLLHMVANQVPGYPPYWVYRLWFRPDPPLTTVSPSFHDGIELYSDPRARETIGQAASLCEHLGLDPADLAPQAARMLEDAASYWPRVWRRITGKDGK